MNKRYVVRLSTSERAHLEEVVSKGQTSARKIVHAQILLKVDEDGPGWTDERTAEAFGVHTTTVRTVRERFVTEGFESALNRKPQVTPSRHRILDGAGEAHLIALACGKPPEGQVRWTLRLLAGKLIELKIVNTTCHETVRQTLKKTS